MAHDCHYDDVTLADSKQPNAKWSYRCAGIFPQCSVKYDVVCTYRSTSFRSSKILQILRLSSNVGRGWVTNNYQYSSAHRGQGSILLGGVAIDLKFLACCILVLAAAWIFRLVWLRIQQKKLQDSYRYFLAPTPVPYSAEVLWLTASICVRCVSSLYCILDERRRIQQNSVKRLFMNISRGASGCWDGANSME